MQLRNIIFIFSMIALLAGTVSMFLNIRNKKQELQQQRQLFESYLQLQQRSDLADADIRNDSTYLEIREYALNNNDSLLLKALDLLTTSNGPRPATNNVIPKKDSSATVQKTKGAQAAGAAYTQTLEDSLKKVQVLLEMEQSVAREQMEQFRKTSDSLLQLLQNNTVQTGILYLKSPTGISVQYVGEIKNNEASGFGMGIWENGQKYEGQWLAGNKHGTGTYYFSNGEKYEGHFVNNKRNGKGTYYFKSGDYYKGYWTTDMRAGIGAIYGRNGKIKKAGEWKNDKLVTNRRLTEEELQEIR